MAITQKDSTITICYEGKLDNGEVFKSISEDSPFTIKLGDHQLPPLWNRLLSVLKRGRS